MPSIAENIANAVTAKLNTQGLAIPPDIRTNLPAIVQLFIVLSGPVRAMIRGYLVSMQAQLSAGVTTALALSTRADYLAAQIGALRSALSTAKGQVDKTLTIFPMDQVIKQSPDLAKLMTELTDFLPIQVPSTLLTQLAGIGGFDFFAGILNYKDLSAKVDELFFRASRAVALSNYANQANREIQTQLDKIRVYVEIIDNLNLAISSVAVTPSALAFGNVAVGQEKFLTLTFANTSTGVVSYTAAIVGVSKFSVVSGLTATLYSPSSVSIIVAFSPTSAGAQTGTLQISHFATAPASPISISLSGTGT